MSNLLVVTLTTLLSYVVAEGENMAEKKPIEVPSDSVMIRPFTIHDFVMEIILVITFLLYAVAWYQGKSANLKRAKTWLGGQLEYLQSQFALVGDGKSVLMKDGPADYLLYVSGRRHVQFGHWWLKLKPRNDMLTYFTTQVLSMVGQTKPVNDRVTLSMVLDKALPEKFVFAVIKKSESAELSKKRFDLNRVAKLGSSKAIPASLTVYTESQKLADLILSTTNVGKLISDASDRLEYLVISSLPADVPYRYENDEALTISLSFSMSNSNTLDPLVELACELPDTLSELKLTSDIRNQVNKNRESLRKEYAKRLAADKAEEAARKKAEAKRAEEERIKKMSPAEQRKWEEKERLRQLKKQQKKRKV
ncbi:hypothetical protein G6F70_001639 [Rhizopus microsporus]|uniref:Coiled-coil domain-containing protein 47 n=2 Tax=Rhizopus TaxID=4842 RepID=A0A367ITX7_RHIAZ|nr:hypothetical protein G6F71_000447 [Rhizopus microsporus]RCH81145.1 Coiled-coil domain-containing protein 47 [Rhizopus azygosporus]KAG1203151.1 hypothetical protein G6F70_001639 [Rhizopus microsporus]KAG1215604.1 hypothetical protein G6F69_000868 [Rhizopus microsporus]KAG1238126.1 hypothetical protein G6F67_000682 [Rhizopus microsporus]